MFWRLHTKLLKQQIQSIEVDINHFTYFAIVDSVHSMEHRQIRCDLFI